MKVLLLGQSSSGKSQLGDIVKNTIFKMDGDSIIRSYDPDRSIKSFGSGSREYHIYTRQLGIEESVLDIPREELESYDIVICLTSNAFSKWLEEVYT